jgi:hypothetical protein
MYFTPEQLASIFNRLKTLESIKDYFHLTDEQLEHPGCAEYIHQILLNMETPGKLMRQMGLQKDFPVKPPFPAATDPGTPQKENDVSTVSSS